MHNAETRMSPKQMASLIDAAFRTSHPLAFLDAAVATFKMMGRHADAVTAAWIGHLHAEGEMEIFLGLRAAWRRGEERSPGMVARSASGQPARPTGRQGMGYHA